MLSSIKMNVSTLSIVKIVLKLSNLDTLVKTLLAVKVEEKIQTIFLFQCSKEIYTYPKQSKSEKIKVLLTSKPHAMISFAFSLAYSYAFSVVRSFQRYFSSSVNCITNGTSNTSCSHLIKTEKFYLRVIKNRHFSHTVKNIFIHLNKSIYKGLHHMQLLMFI